MFYQLKVASLVLTGEPFEVSKAAGSKVISGALNGETVLTIRADKLPVDSRYARIWT
jgi:cation transport ATPase